MKIKKQTFIRRNCQNRSRLFSVMSRKITFCLVLLILPIISATTLFAQGRITINSSVASHVYGNGESPNGAALTSWPASTSGNSVTINQQGVAPGNVVGGHAGGAANVSSTNNSVIVNGGKVIGNVIGGQVDGASVKATNNTLTIRNSATIGGSLMGGNAIAGAGDLITGNTLNLRTCLSVKEVKNFENIRLFLPSNAKKNMTLLAVTNAVDLTDVNVAMLFDDTAPNLMVDDEIRLISKVTGTFTTLTVTLSGFTFEIAVDPLNALNAKVTSAPPFVAPRISGPAEMTIQKGYTETSTNAFTISSAYPVTVTKTAGHELITWNNTDQKLDIAEGLPAGKYPVTLRAANRAGYTQFTFTLKVEAIVYWLEIGQYAGGSVHANVQYIAAEGDTITLAVTPDKGYEMDTIYIHHLNNAKTSVPLKNTEDSLFFIMPAFHINIVAVFKEIRTSIEEPLQANGLKAYVQNGVLYVSGVQAGATLRVYSISGALVATFNPSEGGAYHPLEGAGGGLPLPARGVYLVTDGNRVAKIIN